MAFVGQHDLSVDDEPGSKSYTVTDIIIHPDWKIDVENYDADIAVLILRDFIGSSAHISPICLPQSWKEGEGKGKTVGWSWINGKHEFSSVQNELETSHYDDLKCFSNYPLLEKASSLRTFCAGSEGQQAGVCFEGSAAGFYKTISDNTWELAGIVSFSDLKETNSSECGTSKVFIYTNVAKFLDWIDETMTATEESVWKTNDYNCSQTDNRFVS